MGKAVGLRARRRALRCVLLVAAMACPALAQAHAGGANGWIEARTFNHAGYGDYRVELIAPDGSDAAPSVPFAYLTSPSIGRTVYGGEGTVALNRVNLPNVLNNQVAVVGAQLGKTSDMAAVFASDQVFPGTPAEDRLCTVRARVIAARPDGTLVWQRYWSRYHRGTADLCGATDNTRELKVDYVHTSATGAVLAMFPRVVLQKSSVPEGGGNFFATADPDVLFESVQENGGFSIYRHVLSTGERTLVRAGIPTSFWPSDVSPDGRTLVNTFGPDLEVLDLATGAVTKLLTAAAAGALAPASGPGTRLEDPQFSPDGALLAFRRDDTSEAGGFDTLMTVGVDGSSPRVVRALAPGRAMHAPSWSVIAGVPVGGRLMQRACGTSSCRQEPLDGATVTATRPGVAPVVAVSGDDGRFRLALTKGTWTVTPTLRDAVFDPKTKQVAVDVAEVKDVDFETCGPSPEPVDDEGAERLLGHPLLEIKECPPDFVVDAVEVVQRVQAKKWWVDAKLKVPGVKGSVPGGYYNDGDGDGHARATVNVKGISTRVRVYVRVSDGAKAAPAPKRVDLHVFAGGRDVVLEPVSRPKTLDPEPSLHVRRLLGNETYNFVLPPELADAGSLTLMAEIVPAANTECVELGGKSCKANNRWALARVPFRTTQPYVATTFDTRFMKPGGTLGISAVDVGGALGQARFLPFRPGDLRIVKGGPVLDAISPVLYGQEKTKLPQTGVLDECMRNPDCPEHFYLALAMESFKTILVGTPHPIVTHQGLIAAGIQGSTRTGVAGLLTISAADRDPLTIVHELLHGAGLEHASSGSGCGETAPDPTPWPDQDGSIVGWGFDPNTGKPLGPGAKDVMSYCAKSIGSAWISNLHWNTLVDSFSGRQAPKVAADAPSLAAVAGVRLLAVVDDAGGTPYVAASPVRAVATVSDPNGSVTVTAYDDAGTVIATLRAADLGKQPGSALIDVVLPVPEAARIELTHDGGQTNVLMRSPNAPVVQLSTQRGGGTVGPKTRLRVAWTATDTDGDALRSDLQYAPDGTSWRTVASAGPETSIVLPAGTLTAARRGRLRVVVSDGLRSTIVTSGPLRVTAAPPRVVLTSKATLRLARSARGELSAYAVGEAGVLPGRSLRWFEGKKALGRGERLTVRYAKKGMHAIRLVATDRTGRSTTKTLRVIVR